MQLEEIARAAVAEALYKTQMGKKLQEQHSLEGENLSLEVTSNDQRKHLNEKGSQTHEGDSEPNTAPNLNNGGDDPLRQGTAKVLGEGPMQTDSEAQGEILSTLEERQTRGDMPKKPQSKPKGNRLSRELKRISTK